MGSAIESKNVIGLDSVLGISCEVTVANQEGPKCVCDV